MLVKQKTYHSLFRTKKVCMKCILSVGDVTHMIKWTAFVFTCCKQSKLDGGKTWEQGFVVWYIFLF